MERSTRATPGLIPLLLAGALAGLAALGGCSEAPKASTCQSTADCPSGTVCRSGVCQEADLVAPTVTARTPAPDATNVWWDDPITLTFSEPIDPASVTDASLLLTGPGGGSLTKTWSVAGATVTVRLPQPPAGLGSARFTATLSGQIRDLAGNPLQGAPVTWGWEVPEWQDAAPPFTQGLGASFVFSQAVGPQGTVFLAWQDTYGPGSPPEVKRSGGGVWTSLARSYPVSFSLHRPGSAIGVDSRGRPVVALAGSPTFSGPSLLHAFRHDGTSWVALGGALNANPASAAHGPKLGIDTNDQPVVLWSEAVGNVDHLFAKRWNGSSWDPLGGETPTDPTSSVSVYALAVGTSGAVSIAYVDGGALQLRRLGPGGWIQPGPATAADASDLALAFDGAAVEVAAYTLASGGIEAARWAGPFPGGFARLGTPLSSSGSHPSIAYRPGGQAGQQLVVGFVDAGPRVLGWDGTGWNTLAATIGTPLKPIYGISGPALAVGASGVLSCIWGEVYAPFTPQVMAKRFNR